MNIMITGGAGFIGSNLSKKLLKLGHYVINLDSFNNSYSYKIKIKNICEIFNEKHNDFIKFNKKKNLTIFSNYINNNKKKYKLFVNNINNIKEVDKIFKINKIDLVIHLASLTGVRDSFNNFFIYKKTNIIGTINILNLCNKYNIKKFILGSSSSVYGENKKKCFSEKDNINKLISPYAFTKRCSELSTYLYNYLYKIDIIILRFFNVYGPKQRPDLVIYKFTNLIYKGIRIPFLGNGNSSRDYTYIDDIIEGIIKSLYYLFNSNNCYEIINLGSNNPITLNIVVKKIENILNIKAKINKLPRSYFDVYTTCANIFKAKKMINYFPKVNFSNGLKKFIKWFKKNKL